MLQRQPRVGDIVDDYCPRERRVSDHAVVAMVGDGIRLTRCTTCDTEHEYRQAKVPQTRKKLPAALAPKPLAPASVAVPRAPEPAADTDAPTPAAVVAETAPGMIHGFFRLGAVIDRARDAHARCAAALRRAFSEPSPSPAAAP